MEFKSLWWFKILEFKSLWGCQISGFKSLCRKSSRRLKAFSRNPAGSAGAHNKIPALDCIEIPKRKLPSRFRIVKGSYKQIYKIRKPTLKHLYAKRVRARGETLLEKFPREKTNYQNLFNICRNIGRYDKCRPLVLKPFAQGKTLSN